MKLRIYGSICKVERVLVEMLKDYSLTIPLDVCVISFHKLCQVLKSDASTYLTTQLESSLVLFGEPKCGEPK